MVRSGAFKCHGALNINLPAGVRVYAGAPCGRLPGRGGFAGPGPGGGWWGGMDLTPAAAGASAKALAAWLRHAVRQALDPPLARHP